MQTPTNQLALTIGQCATLACLLEATAPKPGNVHRGADFEDLTYPDWCQRDCDRADHRTRDGVFARRERFSPRCKATQQVVSSNSNLGMILLMAPLAAAASRRDYRRERCSARLGWLDTPTMREMIYEAIRRGQARRSGERQTGGRS